MKFMPIMRRSTVQVVQILLGFQMINIVANLLLTIVVFIPMQDYVLNVLMNFILLQLPVIQELNIVFKMMGLENAAPVI